MNQIAVIISSYIGSLFLDFMSMEVLTIISISLFLASLIPLNLLEFNHEKNDKKIDLLSNIKQIPFKDLYLFGTYELINVVKFLFPLYLFIYVKNNYQIVGIMSLLSNLATILFAYFYGKKINGSHNYLKFSILFVVITFILKANVTSYFLILIAFLEGISCKMYELSISKEFYSLSKKFEYENYNLVYEVVQNTFRSLGTLILFLFLNDLKMMIYIILLFILTGVLFKFKHLEINDYSNKIE